MEDKQQSLDLALPISATGTPWAVDKDDPATVPVPLPVILVKIDGPYTERDRKLWAFLLHAAWDDLEGKAVHEISIREINNVFRELGGEHDTGWIWDCARRLARTIVEWEYKFGDERLNQGISSIFSAQFTRDRRQAGRLYYSFPPLLIPIIKHPGRFSRLRTHFMIGLSGKHAVTLYQILEGFINQRKPELLVPVEDLRKWLHIKDDAYKEFKAFNQWVLKPALKEINKDPAASGFRVQMQTVKTGKVCTAVRFRMTKSGERSTLESKLSSDMPPTTGATGDRPTIKPETYEKARKAAPGWDVYLLESEWLEWWRNKGASALKSPDAAFLGFCRRRFEREGTP